MVDSGQEAHFGRRHRVVLGEEELELEYASWEAKRCALSETVASAWNMASQHVSQPEVGAHVSTQQSLRCRAATIYGSRVVGGRAHIRTATGVAR